VTHEIIIAQAFTAHPYSALHQCIDVPENDEDLQGCYHTIFASKKKMRTLVDRTAA
jgi:hypothetical protein